MDSGLVPDISHFGGSILSNRDINGHLPRCALAGSCNWTQNQDWNPCTLIWEAGIQDGILTSATHLSVNMALSRARPTVPRMASSRLNTASGLGRSSVHRHWRCLLVPLGCELGLPAFPVYTSLPPLWAWVIWHLLAGAGHSAGPKTSCHHLQARHDVVVAVAEPPLPLLPPHLLDLISLCFLLLWNVAGQKLGKLEKWR